MTRFGLRLISLTLLGLIVITAGAMLLGHVLPLEDELLVVGVIRGNDLDIYRIALARQLVVPMTHNTTDETYASWSPDGEQIAFMSNRSGSNAIYVMDAQGRSVRRISDGQVGDYNPVWSPDGRQIVYVNYNISDLRELLLYDMTSGTTRHLIDDAGYDNDPSWSPDGRYIAFVSSRYTPNSELLTLDLDDGRIHRITYNTTIASHPLWSPDGRYILFYTGKSPGFYLWDVLEEKYIPLVEPQSFIGYSIYWSPDSSYLIYANFISETRTGIFRIDMMNCIQQPANCTPELLISTPDRYFNPRWRPHRP